MDLMLCWNTNNDDEYMSFGYNHWRHNIWEVWPRTSQLNRNNEMYKTTISQELIKEHNMEY